MSGAGALAGRCAVITGASQGIGRAIALAFAESGAHIVCVARSEPNLAKTVALARATGGSAEHLVVDLRDEGEIAALGATVVASHGAIDVLVCNSGIAGPTAQLWDMPLSAWDEVMAVNLRAVFLCCKAFLPTMIGQRQGSVILVGSVSGKTPLPGRTPYTASKLGLVGLMRTLAVEVGPQGLRVNLISPGMVAGPRVDAVIEAQAKLTGKTQDEVRERLLEATALDRFVPASDVAEAAVFLAGDASRSITGQDINVAAGSGYP